MAGGPLGRTNTPNPGSPGRPCGRDDPRLPGAGGTGRRGAGRGDRPADAPAGRAGGPRSQTQGPPGLPRAEGPQTHGRLPRQGRGPDDLRQRSLCARSSGQGVQDGRPGLRVQGRQARRPPADGQGDGCGVQRRPEVRRHAAMVEDRAGGRGRAGPGRAEPLRRLCGDLHRRAVAVRVSGRVCAGGPVLVAWRGGHVLGLDPPGRVLCDDGRGATEVVGRRDADRGPHGARVRAAGLPALRVHRGWFRRGRPRTRPRVRVASRPVVPTTSTSWGTGSGDSG